MISSSTERTLGLNERARDPPIWSTEGSGLTVSGAVPIRTFCALDCELAGGEGRLRRKPGRVAAAPWPARSTVAQDRVWDHRLAVGAAAGWSGEGVRVAGGWCGWSGRCSRLSQMALSATMML